MGLFDGAGGGIIGGLINYVGGQSANQANADMSRIAGEKNLEIAHLNNKFMERMSSTAHQREVEDLKAAGLNPIMSSMGGASTPSASGASAVAGHAENTLEGLGSAVSAMSMQKRELEQRDKALAVEDKKADIQGKAVNQQGKIAEADVRLKKAQERNQDMNTIVQSKGIPEAEIKNMVYESLMSGAKDTKERIKKEGPGTLIRDPKLPNSHYKNIPIAPKY